MSSEKKIALVYEYKRDVPLKSINVGDYIQTLAALQFYERVDGYVDRDNLGEATNFGQAKGIINGWYSIENTCHIIPSLFTPLLVSIHINNQSDGQAILPVLMSWKKFAPIGCRDLSTLSFLKSFGIDSYFSSCLTTTLKRENFSNTSQRSGVVCTDVPYISDGIFPLSHLLKRRMVRKLVGRAIKDTCSNSDLIVFETHAYSPLTTHKQRFEEARRLLQIYANAELVITGRIHCALPCLALGTPVILITKSRDSRRYPGLEDLLNVVYLSESYHKVETKNGRIVNSDKFKQYAERLSTVCNNFMKS